MQGSHNKAPILEFPGRNKPEGVAEGVDDSLVPVVYKNRKKER